jgi:hypothetical protein
MYQAFMDRLASKHILLQPNKVKVAACEVIGAWFLEE